MNTLYFSEKNIDFQKINHILKNDGLIAFPTETVYGLGAFIYNEKALEKIYTIKKREKTKALIIHLHDPMQAKDLAYDIPDSFYKLAKHFLPGPLTIVLKKKDIISNLVSSFDTVAIRVPDHSVTLKLLKHIDQPIVGTSANFSTYPSPTTFGEVKENFDGIISCIIDGGECAVKKPSTIISLGKEIKVYREGEISLSEIKKII